LSGNADQKAKMLMGEVARLKQNLNKEQYNCQELQKKLHGEKLVTNTVIDNLDTSIRNLKMALVGNLILSAILLLFVTIQKKAIFKECGDWFKDRATNLYNFFRWLKDGLYRGTYQLIEGKLHAGEVGSNLLTILVILLICAGLFMLLKKAKEEFDDKSFHALNYAEKGKPFKIFKSVISVDIAIGLFVACLTFYEPFKKAMPSLNIFTIWLLLTFVGMLIWNGKELIKGFRYEN